MEAEYAIPRVALRIDLGADGKERKRNWYSDKAAEQEEEPRITRAAFILYCCSRSYCYGVARRFPLRFLIYDTSG